jgi:hypothetical protein
VKRRQISALLVGVSLILALVLSSCSSGSGATPAATVTVTTTKTAQPTTTATGAPADKTYKVLNPQGSYIPVETHTLAARLDKLDGKKVFFYQSEANPVMLPILLPRLQKDYPTATFTREITEGFGRSTPTDTDKTYQAAIRGISW